MINIYLDSTKHYYSSLTANEFFSAFDKDETRKQNNLKKYIEIIKDELNKFKSHKDLIS